VQLKLPGFFYSIRRPDVAGKPTVSELRLVVGQTAMLEAVDMLGRPLSLENARWTVTGPIHYYPEWYPPEDEHGAVVNPVGVQAHAPGEGRVTAKFIIPWLPFLAFESWVNVFVEET